MARKASVRSAECGSAVGTGTAADFLPARRTLALLRTAAACCQGCDLWTCGRTVFGEGPTAAAVMLVGEQPGDQEEKAGHPFVGPSGKLLDAALDPAVTLGTRALLREGCDHTLATCAARFGNAANFQGEPFLPGNDVLVRYPTSSA